MGLNQETRVTTRDLRHTQHGFSGGSGASGPALLIATVTIPKPYLPGRAVIGGYWVRVTGCRCSRSALGLVSPISRTFLFVTLLPRPLAIAAYICTIREANSRPTSQSHVKFFERLKRADATCANQVLKHASNTRRT